jgi:hypothetical protein
LYGGIIYEELNLLRYKKSYAEHSLSASPYRVPYTCSSELPQQTCLSATTRVGSNNRSYQPSIMGWESVNGQPVPIRTVGCGDCKGISCSNSNLKNVTDTDMTEDL